MSDELMNSVQQETVAPEAQSAPVRDERAQPQEKLLTQSEVNELAGKIRSEAYERAFEKAKKEIGQDPYAAQRAAQQALTKEQVMEIVQEQSLQMQQEQANQMAAQRVVGEFMSKMEAGKDKFEDFEESIQNMGLDTMPQLVQLANSVQNTDEVMYDLAKNPYKVGNLMSLVNMNPNLALAEIRRLSNSINFNKNASDRVSDMRDPLSQVKPSAGTADSGPSSVSDFRKASWLRR